MKILLSFLFLVFFAPVMAQEKQLPPPPMEIMFNSEHVCQINDIHHLFAEISIKNISESPQSVPYVIKFQDVMFIPSFRVGLFPYATFCPSKDFCGLPLIGDFTRRGHGSKMQLDPGQTKNFIIEIELTGTCQNSRDHWNYCTCRKSGYIVMDIYDKKYQPNVKEFHYTDPPQCTSPWIELTKLY